MIKVQYSKSKNDYFRIDGEKKTKLNIGAVKIKEAKNKVTEMSLKGK